MVINYYKVQSTYFVMFIAISALAIAMIPSALNSLSESRDAFAMRKMDYLQTEMVLNDYAQAGFRDACTTGFLSAKIYEVEREVVCRINDTADAMLAYVKLNNDFYYIVDSRGNSCMLPDKPRPSAVDCKHAFLSPSRLS